MDNTSDFILLHNSLLVSAADLRKRKKTYAACMNSSISLKDLIPPDVLVAIVKGEEPVGAWGAYLDVFFNECPASWVRGLADENTLTKQDLVRCYKRHKYQPKHFKETLDEAFPE